MIISIRLAMLRLEMDLLSWYHTLILHQSSLIVKRCHRIMEKAHEIRRSAT